MKQSDHARRTYDMHAINRGIIVVSPWLVLLAFFVLLWLPQTSDFTDALTHPRHPLEWTMFAVHVAAGIYGLRLAWLAKKNGEPPRVYLFYTLFSVGLLWIAGEINAWGQKFFDYETPAWFAAHNEMGIVTLHNLTGWDNRNHWLRLAFAIGGFAGIAAQRSPRWRRIAAPSILASWFAAIALKSLLDVWVKDFPIGYSYDWALFDWVVNRLSKIVKIMVGITSLLYFRLNYLRLRREWTKERG